MDAGIAQDQAAKRVFRERTEGIRHDRQAQRGMGHAYADLTHLTVAGGRGGATADLKAFTLETLMPTSRTSAKSLKLWHRTSSTWGAACRARAGVCSARGG